MEMATFKFSRIFNDDIGALGNAKCESVEWQTQDSIRYCRQSLFRYEMASSSSSHTIARRFDDPHFNALFALSTRFVFPLRPVGRWRGKMKNFQMANFYRSFLFILTLGSRIFRRCGWTRDIRRGWRRRKNLKKIYCADHHKNIPDFNISTFLALAQRKNFSPSTNSGKDFHSPIMRWYSPSAGCCCRSNNPHYQQQLSSSPLSSSSRLSILHFIARIVDLTAHSTSTQLFFISFDYYCCLHNRFISDTHNSVNV